MKSKVTRLMKKVLLDPDPAAMPIQAFHNLDQAAFAIYKEACGNLIFYSSEVEAANFKDLAEKSFQAADVFFEIRRSR
jgi:hypothetical protein